MSFLYRVRVINYPKGSDVYGWAPDNWEHPGSPSSDPSYEDPVFHWPHQRQYISLGNAQRRAQLFRKYGAEVVVERSSKIEWPGKVVPS